MEVVSAAVDSTEVDSGSMGDSDAASDLDTASDMDVASDFMAAIPTLMADMGMAAVRITTAPTGAIEQHGALVLWRGRGGAHPRGATRGSVVIAAGLPRTPAGVYEGVMNMTRIDLILFALSLVTTGLPLGITYTTLLTR